MADQRFRYFHVLATLYMATLMTSLLVAARLIPIELPFIHLSLIITGGTWMIPLSFVIQDMTTEIYGYRVSRQLVQLSLLILIGVVLFLKITTHFPIPNHPNVDFAYDAVFNTIPRHLLALLVAMVCGNLFNDYLLSKLKTQLKGKYMAARFIFSTMAGEALLQLAGTTVAWVGNLRFTTEILPFVLFSYCYKIIFSALITPVNVMICQSLKKLENRDTFDNNISYNPFSIKTK